MRAAWLLVLLGCTILRADEAPPADDVAVSARAARFEDQVQPFLRTYCVSCHGTDEPEAELSLVFDAMPAIPQDVEQWTTILQKVAGHDMPPEDELQPSDEQRDELVHWIEPQLAELDCTAQKVKPRTTVRRLNREEYNRVVEDLFGLGLHPAEEFPADNVGEGFDNIGSVLSLPPLLMEKYLDSAEQITDALADDAESWRRVFGFSSTDNVDDATLRDAIAKLASKAFRRPVLDEELTRLMQFRELARGRQASLTATVQWITQAILISPQFLFRIEENSLADPDHPEPLDSYAIASRLSFFLWSSLPDERLNELAAQNALQDPQVIAEQALRMIGEPKGEALVENFVAQWLELRLLQKAAPDPDLFPSFDESLRLAMVEETSAFFRDLMQRDGSILKLLDSDYTFLNERLARHYGIDGVQGEQFQRVNLPDDRRGGVLTQASILTLTSNPTRTSPVKRGKWILENILGTPPPPPPPNVPELADDNAELLGSLRERMQQHRENPSCAVCHRKMDALGFGFENFDGIGAWRDQDGRHEIDPAGELPGNQTFTSPAQLRQILLGNSRDFTGCLAQKLLTYALGRALSSRDRCVVDDIVSSVEANDHRFSSLIVAIVTSDAFRFSGDTYPDVAGTKSTSSGGE